MLYHVKKSYSDNVRDGPQFNGVFPKRVLPPKEQWIDFLGYPVASPLGVPAGPLLTSEWTTLAAKLGFDIVTYKTIRSHSYEGHPLPNILYVKPEKAFAVKLEQPPVNLTEMAITNSFGMPSQSPEFLEEDIPRANSGLGEGQVLVVSIVGGSEQDFVNTALLAKKSGAKIIEANFSCPNVKSKEGSLYTNPEEVFQVCSALTDVLKEVPLIIKVGVFPDSRVMKEVLIAMARSGARAISGINTISQKVVDEQGNPALGSDRITSGICGAPIKNKALEFVKEASSIIKKEKLDLTLIGVGGMMQQADFTLFLEAGAQFVQTATGMMWNPYLAMEYHNL
jgi:dihydroorotate dehydrogenase